MFIGAMPSAAGVLLLPTHADSRVLLHGNTGIQCLGTSITHDPRCRMQEDWSGQLQRCGFAVSHSGDMVARLKSLRTNSHSHSSSSSSSHSSSSFMSKMDLTMYDVVWEVGKEGGAPQPRLDAHNVSGKMSYCCNSNDTVSALAFSTDGKMLAVLVGTRSSLDGTLKSCTIEVIGASEGSRFLLRLFYTGLGEAWNIDNLPPSVQQIFVIPPELHFNSCLHYGLEKKVQVRQLLLLLLMVISLFMLKLHLAHMT